MLALLLLTAALVGACFVVGQGIVALCGAPSWRWWAPAVGYAALLVIGGQALRLPQRATAALIVMAVVVLGALALPFVRNALREAGPGAALLGLVLILIGAVPFFAAGHTGVIGAGVSDDMSSHLLAAFYIRTHDGALPAAAIGGDLISTGYPLGPHGLAAALVRLSGAGEERAFAALILAVPVITAFSAAGIAAAAPRAARWALASAVGFAYLPAAYLAQGSFKETIETMLVLTSAVALADLARGGWPRGLRSGMPIGILAAGAVYTYSYGGAFWVIGVAATLLVAELLRRCQSFRSILRRGIAPAAGAVVVAALALAPEAGRIQDFTHSIFGAEPRANKGNLLHALNPLETLGIWFSGDFRFTPSPAWPSLVLCAIALAVLAAALPWWWRRRELALPAAAVAALLIWADLALTRNIYNAAKGLVVLSPLVVACIGAPLAMAWSGRPETRRERTTMRATRALGVVLLAAALVSSAAVLRSAPVGLGDHERELAAMRPLVNGKRVLFLSNDHFAQWELRGAHPYTTGPLYTEAQLPQRPQKRGGSPVDADNYASSELDKVDFILSPGGRYQSEIPPNFQLAQRTASFALYRRAGPTPLREPAEAPRAAGAVLDCKSQSGKALVSRNRWAGVLPQAVVRADWDGSIGRPGDTARLTVRLPRGRWDVSVQYVSHTGLVARAPALHADLAPSFGSIVAYWPAGTLTSTGAPLTLSLTAKQRSWFGRLIGAPRPARAHGPPDDAPLWHAAFTRHAATPRRVSARAACGRYVDWLAPAGSAMTGRSAG